MHPDTRRGATNYPAARASLEGPRVRILGVPGQIVRIALFSVLAIVVLLFVRQRFVPESFGDIGHYRAVLLVA